MSEVNNGDDRASEVTELDFALVRRKVERMRYSISDILTTGGYVRYVVVRNRDYGFSSLMYFPDSIGVVLRKGQERSASVWEFKWITVSPKYVSTAEINVQDTYADKDPTHEFDRRVRNTYKLSSPAVPGIREEEALIFLNDVSRQMARFSSFCDNTCFGFSLCKGPYVCVLDNEARAVRMLAISSPRANFPFFNPTFSVESVEEMMQSDSKKSLMQRLPRFEKGILTIIDSTQNLFRDSFDRDPAMHPPDLKDKLTRSKKELERRSESLAKLEVLVRESVAERNALVVALEEAKKAVSDGKDTAGVRRLQAILSASARAYEDHTAKRRDLVMQYQQARQKLFGWCMLLDRVIFDSHMFSCWIRRNMERISLDGKASSPS